MAGVAVALAISTIAMRRGGGSSDAGIPPTESLQDVAMREIQRARRYARPLTVVSLSTEQKAQAATVAAELRSRARVNDVVGYLGGSTIVAVLPETEELQATVVVRRIAEAIDHRLVPRIRVRIAAFPRDDVTWIGLCESLRESMRPLDDFRASLPMPELARDLSPRGISDRGDSPASTVLPPTQAIDSAA